MELLLHQWGDWPELYRNTDKTEATEIVIIDSQMNYRGKLDTYNNLRVNENRIFTNDLVYDMVCGIFAAPNNEYDKEYDITSADYGLRKDMAVTKYGKIRIAEDAGLSD